MLSYNLVVITTALFKLKLSDSIRFWTCYIYVKLNFRMWMGSLGLYKYFPIWWLRKEYFEKKKKYTQTATIQIDQNHWKSDSYEKKKYYTCLFNLFENPEEVETRQLLEVLRAPGFCGQQCCEQGRVRWYILQPLGHSEKKTLRWFRALGKIFLKIL